MSASITFRASITDGWNGDELDFGVYATYGNALEFIHRNAPRHSRNVDDVWSFNEDTTRAPSEIVTIIDFGSHQVFGRIVERKVN